MAINFPDSPSNGDTTTLAGKTYTFDSSKSKWSPSGAVTLSALSVGAEGTASGDGGIAYNGAGVFSFTPAVAAGSSVTSYAAPTNFPSSGNSVGDFAFATNAPKALYVWDGAEWDRIYSDSQEGPTFTTTPNSTYALTGGANTDVTVVAVDPDGFPIEYSVATNPTNQAQATITQPSTGVFRFAASNTQSNAGSFTAKFIANDGVQIGTASSSISLGFPYSVEYLLVGGGGSGGNGNNNSGTGGGGAGAFLTSTTTVNPTTVYNISIGAGGVSGSGGNNGTESTAFGIIAGGGGRGGVSTGQGGNGGFGGNGVNNSSGGGGDHYYGGSTNNFGTGNGTGNNGGYGENPPHNGGGGGGAGGVGANVTRNVSSKGDGGVGLQSSITGTALFYAAGGGGGSYNGSASLTAVTGGIGGSGIGGNGGQYGASGALGVGQNGAVNTGSGGGGTAGAGSNLGGTGGSGVAIIKVLTSKYSGTTTGSPTITTSGSHTIIKFTASGSYTA